jgi:hypothetical protein
VWEFFVAISIHIGSYFGYDWNNVHPHVRYTVPDTNVIAGAYYNSERDLSIYGAYKFKYAEVGLVTGYYDTPIPFVRATYDNWYVAPAVYGEKKQIGLVFGYEIKF